MRTMLITLVLCCCGLYTRAQNSIASENGLSINSPSFSIDYLRDKANTNYFNPDVYAGVDGTPYLTSTWLMAKMRFGVNIRVDSVKIRINLFENKIHYLDNDGRERVAAMTPQEILIIGGDSRWIGATFISGCTGDFNTLYQVIEDGRKAKLLKKFKVEKRTVKAFNQPDKHKFEMGDGLYVYTKETLYKEARNCSSLGAFNDDKKARDYISKNGVKCNRESDMRKLILYYNSY